MVNLASIRSMHREYKTEYIMIRTWEADHGRSILISVDRGTDNFDLSTYLQVEWIWFSVDGHILREN